MTEPRLFLAPVTPFCPFLSPTMGRSALETTSTRLSDEYEQLDERGLTAFILVDHLHSIHANKIFESLFAKGCHVYVNADFCQKR